MSLSIATARLVPTLTEVLEVSALQGLELTKPLQGLELTKPDRSPCEPLQQAVLAAVDAALAEFRAQLLAQLQPLFEKAAAECSACAARSART